MADTLETLDSKPWYKSRGALAGFAVAVSGLVLAGIGLARAFGAAISDEQVLALEHFMDVAWGVVVFVVGRLGWAGRVDASQPITPTGVPFAILPRPSPDAGFNTVTTFENHPEAEGEAEAEAPKRKTAGDIMHRLVILLCLVPGVQLVQGCGTTIRYDAPAVLDLGADVGIHAQLGLDSELCEYSARIAAQTPDIARTVASLAAGWLGVYGISPSQRFEVRLPDHTIADLELGIDPPEVLIRVRSRRWFGVVAAGLDALGVRFDLPPGELMTRCIRAGVPG